MCGICGTAGYADRDLLGRMTRLIEHRGPDDEGTYVAPDGAVGLGNRRLSIIDLSPAGHMPMANDDRSLWITYNGEIYNFRELRRELESLGCVFRSHTDTEVVLRGFEMWGIDVFAKLNGMFALAIWDTQERRLVLARDRWGQKPLYYCALGDRFLFASEAKCLLLEPDVPRSIRYEKLPVYLRHLYVPSPETMFDGIEKLEPASVLIWRNGKFTKRRYWEIPLETNDRISDAEAAARFRELLTASVERHLIADVPVGVFLSGGLDSTSIVALAARAHREPVETYTIGYRREDAALEQSGDSDLRHARIAARQFGTNEHEFILEPDLAGLLPKLIWHLDEPLADAAIISSYLICREARPDVKVLLSGQGADEFLAGYTLHQSYRIARQLRRVPKAFRDGILAPIARRAASADWSLPGLHAGMIRAAGRFATKAIEGAASTPEELYLRYRAFGTPLDEISSLLAPDLRAQLRTIDPDGFQVSAFGALPQSLDPLERITRVDASTFLPEINLAYTDKTGSAASVEVRVPFLDTELVDFMLSLPSRLKLRGRSGKYVLRRSMEGIAPPAIIDRRKAPFASPMRRWLRDDLREMVRDVLAPDAIRRDGLFDAAAVTKLVNDHLEGRVDAMHPVLSLLTFRLWQTIHLSPTVAAVEGATA
jgi:asparagine synthase (glutamine-hydrolysing)